MKNTAVAGILRYLFCNSSNWSKAQSTRNNQTEGGNLRPCSIATSNELILIFVNFVNYELIIIILSVGNCVSMHYLFYVLCVQTTGLGIRHFTNCFSFVLSCAVWSGVLWRIACLWQAELTFIHN